MNLEIIPYQGLPSVLFGATEAEIVAVFGQPKYRDKSKHSPFFLTLTYKNVEFGLDGESGLTEIVFTAAFDGAITLAGIDIFGDRKALSKLIQLDGDPWECLGFIMLMKLGVGLAGFHKRVEEGRTISVFKHGSQESLRANFKPYNI